MHHRSVLRLMAERDVVLYCDLHGHSRKNNVFMYGCSNKVDASLKPHERVFPLMMSKNASNKVKCILSEKCRASKQCCYGFMVLNL